MTADTLLVTLTGRDRPGVTARLFGTLAARHVRVVDVEQVVIRGVLVLGVLLDVRELDRVQEGALRTAVDTAAHDLGMQVDLSSGHEDVDPRRHGRLHVTVLAEPLQAAAVAAVAGALADAGANIDRIVRLASYPVTCLELEVSGADTTELRERLALVATEAAVDIAVQPTGLLRRSKRLVVMDVDSTLIQGEVIEMLAAHAGVEPEVARITEAAMRGEVDFEEALRSRVALLAGLDASALDRVYDAIVVTPGARTMVRTLRRLGYRFAIVSGGFTQITERLAADLQIHYSRANELEIVDGRITGRIIGDVVDRAGKATALRHFAAEVGVSEAAVIAIGDGTNDLDMLNAAGLGIAYNAKPIVQDAADTAVNVPYLDAILYLLGISREEIEDADAEAGFVTPAPPV